MRELHEWERRLLNDYQHALPLSPTPYADIAAELGVSEEEVLATLARWRDEGVVSRVGPVFRPNRAGASLLAAMAVPVERLDEVATLVSAFPEVNHNYQRDHRFNLWFVVTAPDRRRLAAVLREIRRRSRLVVLELPLLEEFHLDLGFKLSWQ